MSLIKTESYYSKEFTSTLEIRAIFTSNSRAILAFNLRFSSASQLKYNKFFFILLVMLSELLLHSSYSE